MKPEGNNPALKARRGTLLYNLEHAGADVRIKYSEMNPRDLPPPSPVPKLVRPPPPRNIGELIKMSEVVQNRSRLSMEPPKATLCAVLLKATLTRENFFQQRVSVPLEPQRPSAVKLACHPLSLTSQVKKEKGDTAFPQVEPRFAASKCSFYLKEYKTYSMSSM